mgnify:CR=1 FL=1
MSDVLERNPHSREELFTFIDEFMNLIHKNETMYRQILTSDSPLYFLKKLRREITLKILNIPDIDHEPVPEKFTDSAVVLF